MSFAQKDRATLDARFSHLYFCQSLHTLQRSLSAIAGLLVHHSWKLDIVPNDAQPNGRLKSYRNLK